MSIRIWLLALVTSLEEILTNQAPCYTTTQMSYSSIFSRLIKMVGRHYESIALLNKIFICVLQWNRGDTSIIRILILQNNILQRRENGIDIWENAFFPK